jgi:hypothetical protein
MTFWQKNKLFVVVAGAAFVALVFFWPSLFGLGPTVVSLHRSQHNRTLLEARKLQPAIDEYFGDDPAAIPVAQALEMATKGNKLLLENFEEMNHWMSFVPRFPFRIPDIYQDKNERQKYVSAAYTYVRTGELACKAYGADGEGLNDPSDGIVFTTSSRNIGLVDDRFGLRDMEMPETIADPDTRVMQLALIHDLGHLAIRLGVDEIVGIAPDPPYTWGGKDVEVATLYPVRVRINCNLETLTRFIHALDGAHGKVIKAPAPAEAVDPTRPVGGPADDEEDDMPAPRTIVVQFEGQPSLHRPDPKQRGLRERVTIFRRKDTETSELVFVANAIITRLLGDGKAEAAIEDMSDLCFPADKESFANAVRPGDFAATRFFLVRSIKAEAKAARVVSDDNRYPEEVTPEHLAVDLSVAALRFKELKLPKAAVSKRRHVRTIPYVGY